MRKSVLTAAFALAASPALAAGGPFFSLGNTNFVVLLAFLLFVGILVYFGVPGMIAGLLDERADTIRGELDEARKLREEAQELLASYERKQRDVDEQAKRIVAQAESEAKAHAEAAKADLAASIDRRLKAAEDQIASAEKGAIAEVRNRAVDVAVASAQEAIAKQMSGAAKADALIDEAIKTVGDKLH